MDDKLRNAHRQASDWLILLREEPDNLAAQARLEAWLDSDANHARAWASVLDIFEAIGETAPQLEKHWLNATTQKTGGGLAAPARRRRWLRSPAAGLRRPLFTGAIAAALVLWLAPSALLRLQSDHITGTGEVSAVQLADGSAVQLGPASAIAVEYAVGERTVRLLSGQAWFDVKHNPAAPFRVVAGDVRTTVLGTSFDVRRIAGSTDVSVRHGRVRVMDRGVAPASVRELAAGQWVRISPEHEIEAGVDNADLLGAWRDGSLVVRNRTIADVIEELRPWYGGRIILLSRSLGRQRVDGVYDAHDPAAALSTLVGTAGGTVRRIMPWLIVIY
ncbi:FecR family protein [Sandaracinobacteroides hominis]|uniref:FecR family protein n=1 Tax=Sandaracinobacteroides hominis TaxID=2780086 RepID=UPI0018F3723B|nr:FecR family protein [Sandaracinobacteroides hominis]